MIIGPFASRYRRPNRSDQLRSASTDLAHGNYCIQLNRQSQYSEPPLRSMILRIHRIKNFSRRLARAIADTHQACCTCPGLKAASLFHGEVESIRSAARGSTATMLKQKPRTKLTQFGSWPMSRLALQQHTARPKADQSECSIFSFVSGREDQRAVARRRRRHQNFNGSLCASRKLFFLSSKRSQIWTLALTQDLLLHSRKAFR